MSIKNGMRPVHPGEILRDELNRLGLSANAMTKSLGVSANRISEIIRGRPWCDGRYCLALVPDSLGTTPQLWLNLQNTYDLRRAEIALGDTVTKTVRPALEGENDYGVPDKIVQ